jgi:hypothetical protein
MTNDKAADLFRAMAKDAGFTDEQVAKAMAAPQWKEIENRDNRHSEYSSALDKVKNLEPQAAKAKEWDTWWKEKGGSTLYEQSKELGLYKERYGALTGDTNGGNGGGNTNVPAGVTMAQVQAMLKEQIEAQGARFSTFQSDILTTNAELAAHGITPKAADIAEMNKLMANGATYSAAAVSHFGPRVREMEQQRIEKEKKDAVEQAVKDYASRSGAYSNVPPPGQTSQPSFMSRPDNGVAPAGKTDQELLALWNESAPGRAA